MLKRILVPLDGSRFGSRAVKYAEEIARRFDSEIVLLRVIPPEPEVPVTTGNMPAMTSPAETGLSVETALSQDKNNWKHANRYLWKKAGDIKADNLKVSYQVVEGDAARSIMDFSNSENIDIIIMTTHGKSGLKRMFLGSVADTVIRQSGKPVMVIRPPGLSK
jgi:nucleotide-binding universal stress UspA family protein